MPLAYQTQSYRNAVVGAGNHVAGSGPARGGGGSFRDFHTAAGTRPGGVHAGRGSLAFARGANGGGAAVGLHQWRGNRGGFTGEYRRGGANRGTQHRPAVGGVPEFKGDYDWETANEKLAEELNKMKEQLAKTKLSASKIVIARLYFSPRAPL